MIDNKLNKTFDNMLALFSICDLHVILLTIATVLGARNGLIMQCYTNTADGSLPMNKI